MEQIKKSLSAIKDKIKTAARRVKRNPEDITIVGASKKQNIKTIYNGIEAGIKVFGENYIQEAVDKIKTIGNDELSWHFIGHLQSNKAKLAVKNFDLIHSVDTLKLAKAINTAAEKINKTQEILIQINISEESSKSGVDSDKACILAEQLSLLKNIRVKGIMGMPPFAIEPEDARVFFIKLKNIRDFIEKQNFSSVSMEHLSMGMSQDFIVAIEEGATMVRIGTILFGQRQ